MLIQRLWVLWSWLHAPKNALSVVWEVKGQLHLEHHPLSKCWVFNNVMLSLCHFTKSMTLTLFQKMSLHACLTRVWLLQLEVWVEPPALSCGSCLSWHIGWSLCTSWNRDLTGSSLRVLWEWNKLILIQLILIHWASLVAQLVKSLQCGRTGFDPCVGKIPWRRKRQPTPVFLPGESHGQRSLEGYCPWDHEESDMTELLTPTILIH